MNTLTNLDESDHISPYSAVVTLRIEMPMTRWPDDPITECKRLMKWGENPSAGSDLSDRIVGQAMTMPYTVVTFPATPMASVFT